MKMSLIKLSKNLLVLQKDYGINIQKLSTSPNIQRSGEMNNVKEILNTFNNQDVSMTGKNLETPSRRQSVISLIQKFKKSQIRAAGLRNSWIGLRNTNSQLLRQSNLIENLALKSTTYSRLSICYLIQLKIIKQILNYLRKSLAKKLQNGIYFWRKNLLVQLRNAITHQLLDWTSYPGDISRKSSETLHISINSLILLMGAST